MQLNGLVLLHELLENGLSISGHPVRSELYLPFKAMAKITAANPVFAKATQYLFAITRAALYRTALHEENTIEHFAAISLCLTDILREADYVHVLTSVVLACQLKVRFRKLIPEDHVSKASDEQKAFILMLITQYLSKVAERQKLPALEAYCGNIQTCMKNAGIAPLVLNNVLDRSSPLPLRYANNLASSFGSIYSNKSFQDIMKMPSAADLFEIFSSEAADAATSALVKTIMTNRYSPEAEVESTQRCGSKFTGCSSIATDIRESFSAQLAADTGITLCLLCV